jgi:hypothetical protein
MATEKTTLEKAIENRAKEMFEKDLKNLVEALRVNPIGRRLQIKIKGGNIDLISNSSGALISHYETKELKEDTNFMAIKESIIEGYIKDETKLLLDKIDSLNYFFQENNN